MKKSLPKKVETEIVVSFLDEFGQGMKKEFAEKFGELKGDIEEKFRELKDMASTSGNLISNTHQEVKHFVELHTVLDEQVKNLERRVDKLESLVEKLAH